jgi:hypothetical protein
MEELCKQANVRTVNVLATLGQEARTAALTARQPLRVIEAVNAAMRIVLQAKMQVFLSRERQTAPHEGGRFERAFEAYPEQIPLTAQ